MTRMMRQGTLPLDQAPFLMLSDPKMSVRAPEVRAARAASWYARTPYGLAILRHAEMGRLLIHPSLRQGSHNWAALNGVHSGAFADWWGKTILVTEGADHTRLRRLVNPAFTPKRVRTLMPAFEALTESLMADWIDTGSCDFMADFADPYAGRVLTILMGMPGGMAADILRFAADMGLGLGVTYKDCLPRIDAATEAMCALVQAAIDVRRTAPGDDVLSLLVAAAQQQNGLTEEELLNLGVMIVFAGVDTTRNQLGLGMSLFIEHPTQWEALAANPGLDLAAANECMRLRPTITWVTREAVEDFEFQGLPIAKGTTLHLMSESAGTDPKVFDNAPFDITARRGINYGFGGGIHVCLGRIVARNDMAVAYRLLSRRMTNIRPAGAPAYLPDSGNTGPICLPITFDLR